MSSSQPLVDISISQGNLPLVHCQQARFCISSSGDKGVHPPGTALHQLRVKRNQVVIDVCAECYDALISQDTTKRISGPGSNGMAAASSNMMPPPPPPVDRRCVKGDPQIHQLIAASQRHGTLSAFTLLLVLTKTCRKSCYCKGNPCDVV
uniref:Uncharacterized protein n=1 Tax=Mycena chlorophos TaxID=658473 RepID=A0ABQ0L5G3_MYCCL|nr:predicted protein [Mycena chlorophos]